VLKQGVFAPGEAGEADEAGSWPDECRGGVVLQWYLACQIDDNGMMR
jgi:hypothetical protein